MFRFAFRKKKELSFLDEHPNEFEKAEEKINLIKEKKKSGDIDPVTADKRIDKIDLAARIHDDCLSLVENDPQKRETDRCFHSYNNLLKLLKNASLPSSKIDSAIESSIKYQNRQEEWGERPMMTEAKKTIKKLKEPNSNNQLENQNGEKFAEKINEKMDNYKLCLIWSSLNKKRSTDCSDEQAELIEAIQNGVSKVFK